MLRTTGVDYLPAVAMGVCARKAREMHRSGQDFALEQRAGRILQKSGWQVATGGALLVSSYTSPTWR